MPGEQVSVLGSGGSHPSGVIDLRNLIGELVELLEAIGKQSIQVGIGEVTYAGGTPASEISTVKLPQPATTSAVFYAMMIEASGNARVIYAVGPTLTTCGFQAYSVVGNPPAASKEKYYWLAITE